MRRIFKNDFYAGRVIFFTMQVHKPVLPKEIVNMLITNTGGIYVDATIGFGGHAAEILSNLNEEGCLIGIDKDESAIGYLKENLKDKRLSMLKGTFADLADLLEVVNVTKVDGVLFDLGVSLFQLKELSRGFSFLSDSKLDMRMDTSQILNAWDVVNRYSQKGLEKMFLEYGEEPHAKRISEAIVQDRKKRAINTCRELAMVVERIYGGRGKTHPATRVFQAVRIEVNGELRELSKGLISAYESLRSGGRLCVISYHSLEDRIVKNFFRDCARSHKLKILTKKPIQATIEERRLNPSSRSAKMRGAEKI